MFIKRTKKTLSRCFKINVQMSEVHRCRIKISLHRLHHLHHLSLSISYATVSWFLQQPHMLLLQCGVVNCFQILNQDDLFQTAIQPSAYLTQRVFSTILLLTYLFFPRYPAAALTFTSFCSAIYQFGLFHTTSSVATNRNN